MDEGELEARMLAFLRGEADVLVCTSIIESGIDIPQANTLIVDRADTFGLAQLYQIRGRVGRSRERAYAYLLYPSAAALTQEAGQRLAALSDYTELGAGFKVAMRDLELRGAGNLLGDEQSGHVAALGFELYMQMLDEAVQSHVATRRTRTPSSPSAWTSPSTPTCPRTTSRTSRRRSTCTAGSRARATSRTSALLRDELEDRFGEVPEPLSNLISLQQARIKFGRAGVTAVTFRQGRLAATPVELDSTRAKELRRRLPSALYESGRSQFSMRVPDDPAQRFPAVVQAADALLAVVSGVEEPVAACPIARRSLLPDEREAFVPYCCVYPVSEVPDSAPSDSFRPCPGSRRGHRAAVGLAALRLGRVLGLHRACVRLRRRRGRAPAPPSEATAFEMAMPPGTASTAAVAMPATFRRVRLVRSSSMSLLAVGNMKIVLSDPSDPCKRARRWPRSPTRTCPLASGTHEANPTQHRRPVRLFRGRCGGSGV